MNKSIVLNMEKSLKFFVKTSLATVMVLFALTAWGQAQQNNPYSRYGLGEPVPQAFAHQIGMGSLSAAMNDPHQLNPLNPAASAFLGTTAFEVGLFGEQSTYKSSSDELQQWSGNLSYLNLGMTLKSPINKALDKTQSPWDFGLSVGIAPFSTVSYNITTIDTTDLLGRVASNFTGTGGTYKLRWGGSAKYKQTAFGMNLGWLFGTNRYENTVVFSDSVSTFQDNFRDDIATRGLTWNLGVMHNFVLAREIQGSELPTRWLTVGLYGNGRQKLKSFSDQFRIRSRGELSNGNFVSADTIRQNVDAEYDLTLPSEFAVGLTYVRMNKFKIGGEFGVGSWSQYENGAREEAIDFQNTFSVSVGTEIIPDYLSYNNYAKRIRYRLGGYYKKDPRVVNGEGVNDMGITFGFGLPVILARQQTSFVNTAFEIGKLGAGTAIEETYFRITVGFTMNDNSWFYKRRFE